MFVAFDTSLLVAGLREAHPHHDRALPWLAAATAARIRAIAPASVVAETFAALTAVPGLRLKPRLAQALLTDLLEHVEFRSVSREAQADAIERCARLGAVSGAIFDAVIMACADEAHVEAIITFNVADFERFRQAEGPRVIAPPDPPAVML